MLLYQTHDSTDHSRLLTFFTCQMSQKGNSLNGFAQTHLISQDSVQPFIMHGGQPIQAYMLILSQTVLENWRYFSLYLFQTVQITSFFLCINMLLIICKNTPVPVFLLFINQCSRRDSNSKHATSKSFKEIS